MYQLDSDVPNFPINDLQHKNIKERAKPFNTHWCLIMIQPAEPLLFFSNAAIVNKWFPMYAEVRFHNSFMASESQVATQEVTRPGWTNPCLPSVSIYSFIIIPEI